MLQEVTMTEGLFTKTKSKGFGTAVKQMANSSIVVDQAAPQTSTTRTPRDATLGAISDAGAVGTRGALSSGLLSRRGTHPGDYPEMSNSRTPLPEALDTDLALTNSSKRAGSRTAPVCAKTSTPGNTNELQRQRIEEL